MVTSAPPTVAPVPPGRRARPRGFWTGRILLIASVPIVIATTWITVGVVWTRTHQTIEPPPSGFGYPLTPWARRQWQPPTGPVQQVDTATMTIGQGGRPRTALMSRPIDVTPGVRLPVVILLHGLGGDSEKMFNEGANGYIPARYPTLAVFPEGEWISWNAGSCCRPTTVLGTDDVAFLHALVTDLKGRPEVDPERIYMFGFSGGGMMTYRYMCDHADELAGAMVSAGVNVGACETNAAIPFVHQHGTADPVVPYDGGGSALGRLVGPWSLPSVAESVSGAVTAMGCDPIPAPGPSSEGLGHVVTSQEWSGCRDGARVRLVTYEGMGHWWPVGPPWSAITDALAFFGLGT